MGVLSEILKQWRPLLGFWFAVAPNAFGQIKTIDQIDTGIFPTTTQNPSHGIAIVKTISASDPTHRSMSHCVLQHGYVIDTKKLESLQKSPALARELNEFIASYYGEDLIPSLLATVCERVVVIVQEAVQSSLSELILRTELLMNSLGCPPNAGNCALFGHSKGGAVATQMAIRCMQKTSLLMQAGCTRVREFYSSAGTHWGALFAPVVLGIYLEDPESPLLRRMETFASKFGINLDFTGKDAMDYRPGKTNPVWVDMGPIGKGPSGRPVYADRQTIDRVGWLTGDYAASSSAFNFQEGWHISGCGRRSATSSYKTCKKAARILPFLHTIRYRHYFEMGLNAMRADPRFADPKTGTTHYLDGLKWQDYQVSDGLADYGLAMGPCLMSGTAVTSCTRFNAINHAANAGANRQVIADVISAFSH